jgi:hypothetical protein
MKKEILLSLALSIALYSNSQNSFPATGNVLIGTTTNNGIPLQGSGKSWNGNPTNTGGIIINPGLSRANDVIRLGNFLNTGDGQNCILATSNNSGTSFTNVLVERDGFIGLGTATGNNSGFYVGNPALGILGDGTIQIRSNYFSFGNPSDGPNNMSALTMSVSNMNEWIYGPSYPSGQNTYYFETQLGSPLSPAVRAPLKIGARELHFMTGASDVEAMMISQTGNIGLGTTNINDVNYKLFVETGIRTRKVKVDQIAWPDYVFQPTYPLLPLSELKSFITIYGHLPGIASASQVEKEGLDLGETQAALLKKVEELTLYVIEQDKKMELLQKEIEILKNKK